MHAYWAGSHCKCSSKQLWMPRRADDGPNIGHALTWLMCSARPRCERSMIFRADCCLAQFLKYSPTNVLYCVQTVPWRLACFTDELVFSHVTGARDKSSVVAGECDDGTSHVDQRKGGVIVNSQRRVSHRRYKLLSIEGTAVTRVTESRIKCSQNLFESYFIYLFAYIIVAWGY